MLQSTHVKWFGGGVGRVGYIIKCTETSGTLGRSGSVHSATQVLEQAEARSNQFQQVERLGICARESEDS